MHESSHTSKYAMERCRALQSRAQRIKAIFEDVPERRHKRAAHVVAAVLVAIFGLLVSGLAVSISSRWTIDEIRTLRNETGHIATAMATTLRVSEKLGDNEFHMRQALQDALWILEAQAYADQLVRVHQFLDIAEQRLHSLSRGLESAAHGSLSVETLKEIDFKGFMKKIHTVAEEHNATPIIAHMSDLLQLEASFAASEEGFDVLGYFQIELPSATNYGKS